MSAADTAPEHKGPGRRLRYVDGLRGIAVLMVLLYHAWRYHLPGRDLVAVPRGTWLDSIFDRGQLGVSLFLVLSGFVLTLPALQRLNQRRESWFSTSHFFARRCLRILPPYYAALVLFVILAYSLPQERFQTVSSMGGEPPSPGNLIAHVLLIHNFFPDYVWTVNGSFWSLALEWQWYWLFPVCLMLFVSFPRMLILGALILPVLWHTAGNVLGFWGYELLPARLFEFIAGMVVARLVVEDRRFPTALLVSAGLTAAILAEWSPSIAGLKVGKHQGLYLPFWGVVFAAALLLGHSNDKVRQWLSWSPLAWLGIASYSVYLMHEPVVEAVGIWLPWGSASRWLVIPLAVAAGILVGTVFHLMVERPMMRPDLVTRLAPRLGRRLRWTEGLTGLFSKRIAFAEAIRSRSTGSG